MSKSSARARKRCYGISWGGGGKQKMDCRTDGGREEGRARGGNIGEYAAEGPRGIASGAKIRFARCRLHPRASPPIYLRSVGSIRNPPAPLPPTLLPRRSPSPLPVHPCRHPSTPCPESSNEHRPLILSTATLLDPPPST